MIWVFLTTFGVMGSVMAIMAVGVMAGREPLKGSCGGIGAAGIDQSCEICGGSPQRCKEETQDVDAAPRKSVTKNLFYDADRP
ncbi:MAG: (Na+)-NQR maturation NqrM [Chromatocurvus sp.]